MSEDTFSLYFDCASRSDADDLHTEIEELLLAKDEELWTSQLAFKDKQAIITLGADLESELAEELLRCLLKKQLTNVYAELYFDTAGETQFLAIRDDWLKELKRRPPRKKAKVPVKKKAASAKVSVAYPHMLDPAWQKQREKDWDTAYYSDICNEPKYCWKHIKDYYFDGNVHKFIKGQITYQKKAEYKPENIGPSITSAIDYSPSKTLEQLIEVIRTLFEWYDQNQDDVSDKQLSYQKNFFVEHLHHFSSRFIEHGFDQELTNDAFLWIYGDTYKPGRTFPIPLGQDNWQPELNNYEAVCARIMQGVSDYLFKPDLSPEEEFGAFRYQQAEYSKYLISLLPNMDADFFSRKLFEDTYVNEQGISIESWKQYSFRIFFTGLLGYNVPFIPKQDPPYCRDPEMAESLKTQIFALEMPGYFDSFIEFIHKHGDDAYKYSGR
ncbi:hypothetical protein ACMXYQ_17465 [Neptuniibacter sp. PT34_22]|uniref:hypothetical protein n=1 Tax=Neptuniibacter sp. PT34_22 TaxID=3398205 RepID=UPI0039F49448